MSTYLKSSAYLMSTFGKFGFPIRQVVMVAIGQPLKVTEKFACPICGESFHHGRCVSR